MKQSSKIIRAAAQDAGNRSAHKRGLSAWDEEAWDAACDEFDRLTHATKDGFERRSQLIAESMDANERRHGRVK